MKSGSTDKNKKQKAAAGRGMKCVEHTNVSEACEQQSAGTRDQISSYSLPQRNCLHLIRYGGDLMQHIIHEESFCSRLMLKLSGVFSLTGFLKHAMDI